MSDDRGGSNRCFDVHRNRCTHGKLICPAFKGCRESGSGAQVRGHSSEKLGNGIFCSQIHSLVVHLRQAVNNGSGNNDTSDNYGQSPYCNKEEYHEKYGTKNHPRDRKSTRLNSSHVSISYAVFCLKKKKTF